MKRLRISLMLLLTGAGLSAAAQSSSTGTASASVTSTIRVRIPAAATLTIPQNKQHVANGGNLPAAGTEPEKPVLNRKWILQSERLIEKNSSALGDRRTAAVPPAITLIHTATPE